jgi:PPP family 3-phenylpropionic acid transporter
MAELGANEGQMGLALTISTLTEVPVFFFGDRLVRRFGSHGLFMIALILIGIRSLFYAAVDTTLQVFILQVFSGMMFPALWLAGVSYADENAPAGLKSTAQGLFGAVMFGFGSAVSGFVGGLLLESIGGRGMFLVLGIAILVGLALIEGIKRLLPKEKNIRTIQDGFQ